MNIRFTSIWNNDKWSPLQTAKMSLFLLNEQCVGSYFRLFVIVFGFVTNGFEERFQMKIESELHEQSKFWASFKHLIGSLCASNLTILNHIKLLNYFFHSLDEIGNKITFLSFLLYSTSWMVDKSATNATCLSSNEKSGLILEFGSDVSLHIKLIIVVQTIEKNQSLWNLE